jgi:hypothetical protein
LSQALISTCKRATVPPDCSSKLGFFLPVALALAGLPLPLPLPFLLFFLPVSELASESESAAASDAAASDSAASESSTMSGEPDAIAGAGG